MNDNKRQAGSYVLSSVLLARHVCCVLVADVSERYRSWSVIGGDTDPCLVIGQYPPPHRLQGGAPSHCTVENLEGPGRHSLYELK